MLLTAEFWKYGCWALPLIALTAYLLGSINTGILVVRRNFGTDIRDGGSGNAGFTNVLRTYGREAAIITAAGDLLKSLVSVFFAGLLLPAVAADCARGDLLRVMELRMIAEYTAGLCCILGHMFPLYFGFHGGKGVMTSLGMLLILDWRVALVLLLLFLIVLKFSRMVSLGSVIAAFAFPFATALMRGAVDHFDLETTVFCTAISTVIAAIIIVKHRSNIRRILAGTENKFEKRERGS